MRTLCLVYAALFGMVLAHSDTPAPPVPAADSAHPDLIEAVGPLEVSYPVEDVAL